MSASVHILYRPDPFSPEREAHTVPLVPGKSVHEYVKAELLRHNPVLSDRLNWAVGLSGKDVTSCAKDSFPTAGDSIRICPYVEDFSSFGRTLGMLAIVAAAVVTQQYYLATFGTTVMANGVASYTAGSLIASGIAAGAVSVAGGMLLNAALPPASPDLSSMDSQDDPGANSPSYSYNPGTNPTLNGGCIPVVYGRTRTTPYLIARHVTTDGENQFLNYLFLVAGHEVDSISQIRADGNSITSLGKIRSRLGRKGQNIIQEFSDVAKDKPINIKLSTSWSAPVRSNGNGLEALGIGLRCPALFHLDDKGRIKPTSVHLAVQYRKTGEAWQNFQNLSITAARQGSVRRFIRKDNLPRGSYEVRARFSTAPESGISFSNDCYLEYMQEIAYEDLSYPGCALLAWVDVPAAELANPNPRITCIVERNTVKVKHGGQWVDRPASNPAWASWDAITNRDYGGSVTPERMLDFAPWAEFCTQRGLELNLIIDEASSLPRILDRMGNIGRGQVVLRGTRFCPVYEGPGTPRDLLCVGNIVADSFQEEYLPQEQRANVLEVSYWDKDKDYERETVTVYAQNWASSEEEEIRSSIALYGCTSREQAVKHARFRLAINRYTRRTVTVEAGQDALAHEVYDVILLQHDVPQWGYGGRIAQDADRNTVVLDTQAVASGWHIQVRHQNGSMEERVVSQAKDPEQLPGGLSRVHLATPWTTVPHKNDCWIAGPSTQTKAKPFRITSITRGQHSPVQLRCVEYVDEIYRDDGAVPSELDSSLLAPVAGLVALPQNRKLEGLEKLVLDLSWRGAASSWRIFHRQYGAATWTYDGTTSAPSFTLYNLEMYRIYEVCVTSHNAPPRAGMTISIDFPSGSLEDLELVQEFNDLGELTFVFEDDEALYEVIS